jgi:hydroxymethylpyrimidine pyrophosphatase-like HAD family hydrolase
MDHYGFRLNETMAFGDGQNDIDMIRFVGTGISMGNGIDALKKAADYVTTDIDDDGIANGLRHFGLIQ